MHPDNRRTVRSGPPREQHTETARIEMHQSQLLKINQSQRSILLKRRRQNSNWSLCGRRFTKEGRRWVAVLNISTILHPANLWSSYQKATSITEILSLSYLPDRFVYWNSREIKIEVWTQTLLERWEACQGIYIEALRQRLHESGFICNRIVFDAVTPSVYTTPIETVAETVSIWNRCQKWSVFKTMWLHLSCKQRNRIDLNTATILARNLHCSINIVNLAGSVALASTITPWIFWRKRFHVNTSKPHRSWRGFESRNRVDVKPHSRKRCLRLQIKPLCACVERNNLEQKPLILFTVKLHHAWWFRWFCFGVSMVSAFPASVFRV